MALLFVLPLSSKSYMHKSFSSPTHYKLKAVCRTIPSLRMRKRGKLLKPPYTTMTLETAVSDHDGVQRRVGDYHSNIWDDDAIQSLSTPHGVTSYRERADRLTGEVKEMFNQISLENGELTTPRDDLIQRLWMVDSVERLGIERHFENEIKAALDHVYSYWNEKGIGKHSSADIDLNSTALGFRTLRLHGYPVSSEVLNVFKGQNGQFVCSPSHNIEEEIRSVLNLYRASLIAFPGEKVMEEAEIFSSRYLKEALQKLPVSSLSREIEHVMQYGWHTNLPRWEARNYIDMFGQDTIYSSSFSKNNETLLELAKLEFNIFHSLQQSELQSVLRWWKKSGVPSLTFTRHRHVEYYALASSISPEPKHSAFRLGFTKLCHLLTVLDDMYDTFGTLPELELFTTAVKRWDSSETKHLPEYMKGVYMAVFETVNELAREAEKTQGRNTLNYVRKAWEAHLDSFMEEAKWISSGCLPTFKDYHENGKVSSGYRTATLQPIFTLDAPLPDSILQGIDFPSRFNDLASSFLRLRGDTRCYKADIARGEEASAITCYMKDNPGSTEEDALNHVNAMISEVIKGLNWELLRPDSNVPMSSRKHAFDLTRAFHHLYIYRDGFSDPHKETKTFVMKTLFESVPL